LHTCINQLTVAYQESRHVQGLYAAPIESVYEHIIQQSEFLEGVDAVSLTPPNARWTSASFADLLCSAQDCQYRAALDLPDMLQELFD
jgi:hypothetical protein